jgi:hypothetical protein
MGLLHENKACVYELRAIVDMDVDEFSKENAAVTGLDLAWVVAHAV